MDVEIRIAYEKVQLNQGLVFWPANEDVFLPRQMPGLQPVDDFLKRLWETRLQAVGQSCA
jgi:hypothetical protein